MPAYKVAYDKAIADELRKRFASEIADLEKEGFKPFHLHQELIYPFSVLTLFPIYMAMRAGNEIMQVQFPLRITSYHLMYCSQTHATYAYVYGMGCKFYTSFTDGTWLVSNTHQQTKNEKVIILKSEPSLASMQQIWMRHRKTIAELEAKGKQINHHLSFDTWAKLEQQFDQDNLSSMVVVGSIWLGLVLWILYWLVTNALVIAGVR